MNHNFDTEIATKYGMEIATFLQNIAFWIEKNVANERHLIEGKWWTYNTQKALLKLFPYWTRQNLRTIIKKCVDKKLIVIEQFNKNKYDQTNWYAFTELGLSLFPRLLNLIENNDLKNSSNGWNQPLEKSELTNVNAGTNQPIPDNKPDNITYNKKAVVDNFELPDWLDKEKWEQFKQHRKEIKAPLSKQAEQINLNKLIKFNSKGHNVNAIIEETIANGWKSFFEPKGKQTYSPQNNQTTSTVPFVQPKTSDISTQKALENQKRLSDIMRKALHRP